MNPTDRSITLTSQLYTGTTLAAKRPDKLTALNYIPSVISNASKHRISISLTAYEFKSLTDAEYQSPAWTETAYDSNSLQSANKMVKTLEIQAQHIITHRLM